jgi:hypothetical protein
LTQHIAIAINLQRNTLPLPSTFDPTTSLPLLAVAIQPIHHHHHLTHFIAIAIRCHSTDRKSVV